MAKGHCNPIAPVRVKLGSKLIALKARCFVFLLAKPVIGLAYHLQLGSEFG